MFFYSAQLPILATVLCLVKATGERTDEVPSVAVKNSTYIYVSWGKAFKGCEKEKVQNATVVVGTLTSDPKEEMVSFDEGGAIVEANPCLYQRIRKAVPKIEN